MDPKSTTPAAQPTGTQAQTTPATQGAPETQQDQATPITKKDVEDMLALAVQQIETKVSKINQSSRDRAKTIQTEVTKIKTQLDGLKIPITPEVQSKILEQAEAAVDAAEQTQDPVTPEPPTQPGDEPGPGNPVYEWTTAFYKEAGTEVAKADPEYATIKAALDDPTTTTVKYQTTVMNAVTKKQARIASQQQNPDARTLGGGNHSDQPTATSARDIWLRAHEPK